MTSGPGRAARPAAVVGWAAAALALAFAACGESDGPRRPTAVTAQVSDEIATVVTVSLDDGRGDDRLRRIRPDAAAGVAHAGGEDRRARAHRDACSA